MSDLIKREDVLKQIWEWVTNREFNYTNATHWLQKRIEAIPTIDAVEVVRCKKCKHAHMTYGGDCKYCDMWKDDDDFCIELYLDGDFYCAYGEREGE